MRRWAGKLVRLVLVLICVTIFSFLLMSLLPGDPATTFNVGADPKTLDQIRHDLHLSDPLPVRYVKWLSDFAQGNMGRYYGAAGQTPGQKLTADLPVSLTLMVYSQIVALVIAIPLGVATAYRANSVFDRGTNLLFFVALSVPGFVLAFFLKKYLSIDRSWLPERGWVSLFDNPFQHFRHVVLPLVCLTLSQIAIYARLLRNDMIATLQEDFITMAKAKGLSSRRVLFRHALRPSSLTLLTVAGLNVGTLIGGTVIIERIFGIPGLGTDTVEAVYAREYVALQSFIAIIGILFVLVNFLVDFLYSVLDPRIRSV
jgi:peptide/nickel transport system permease protein